MLAMGGQSYLRHLNLELKLNRCHFAQNICPAHNFIFFIIAQYAIFPEFNVCLRACCRRQRTNKIQNCLAIDVRLNYFTHSTGGKNAITSHLLFACRTYEFAGGSSPSKYLELSLQ